MADGGILVTGATGGIGGQVVTLLHEAGEPVRALARRPQQVTAFRARGIDAVVGNFADRASLEAAMGGVRTLCILTPAGSAQAEYGRNAVRAAQLTGIDRVVHLSTGDANPVSKVPWAAAPARTDALLRVSALHWTIPKPVAFMQNILDSAPAIKRGFLPHAAGISPVGWIDAADIAAVAAKVLVNKGHDNREYVLTGPELLPYRDLAATLANVLGHSVRAVDLPSPVYRILLRLSGVDAFTANGVAQQFADVVRNGRDGANDLTAHAGMLLGRSPVSFEDFVGRHRARFAS